MELYGYQEVGVDFLARRDTALLADEPGLGKTAQLIMAAVQAIPRDSWPAGMPVTPQVLVVCPAVARIMWAREWTRWADDWMFGHRAFIHQSSVLPQLDGIHHRVMIVSYDLLSRGKEWTRLHLYNWELIICDECHYLKGPSNRAAAIYGGLNPHVTQMGLAQSSKRLWLASGTPAPNHVGELYNHLLGAFPDTIRTGSGAPMTREEFEDAYCTVRETQYGRQITGGKPGRAADIRRRLAPHLLRRRKVEVLPNLPPLRFSEEWLEFDPKACAAAAGGNEASYFNATDLNNATWTDEEFFQQLQQNTAHLATFRRLLGLFKVPAVVDWVDNELQGNSRKLIIFAHHIEVLAKLWEAFYSRDYKPAGITGATRPEIREKMVERFQTDPACRVFLGQIQAAGTAITLTAASDVLFAEASWVPSENFQAACRAHRIGQNEGVLARFALLAKLKFDRRMMHVLATKAAEIAALFD